MKYKLYCCIFITKYEMWSSTPEILHKKILQKGGAGSIKLPLFVCVYCISMGVYVVCVQIHLIEFLNVF